MTEMADQQNHQKALEYLQKFGHLGPAHDLLGSSENVLATERDSDIFRAALENFQALALIPVTGMLDQQTLAAMNRPRCGLPDGRSENLFAEFVAFGTVWDHAIITYRFANVTPDMDQARQREIIRDAMERWATVVPLVFREVQQNEDIEINFAGADHGDGNPFDGSLGVLAHAFFPPPNGGALAGDLHYDEDETWQEGIDPDGFDFIDLLTVSVHELGHSLGLDHTAVPNSTMNPFYPTPSTPAQDDRDGMRQVYREHIWVASLYRDLLNRRFDEQGLDGWVRSRFGGQTPENVARGFCYSQEHSNTLATQLYFWLLDRAPDPVGLEAWRKALENGMSRQAAITGFLSSNEYLSANPPPNAFVHSLYRRLLNREPDPAGFNFWVDQMNQGMQPDEVARHFLNSEEFCRNYARGLYNRFLRREPDAVGWTAWTDALKGGLAHQDAMVGFLASPEYRDAVRGWW
jgi:hypothetical protein